MDDWRLGIYLRELTHQGEAAEIAAADLNAALGAAVAGVPRAFAAVQSLLAAAAMDHPLMIIPRYRRTPSQETPAALPCTRRLDPEDRRWTIGA